jgi:hypothetical protein
MREEPREAPAVRLRRRRDQPRQSQSKHAKRWTHCPLSPVLIDRGKSPRRLLPPRQNPTSPRERGEVA